MKTEASPPVQNTEFVALQQAVADARKRVDTAEGYYIYVAVHELRAAELRLEIYLSELTGKQLNLDAERSMPWSNTSRTRVYISGPMTGYANYNRDMFNVVAEELTAKGYAVENPATVQVDSETWEDYMKVDLQMLVQSDMVVALPGWEDSRGAKTEIDLAGKLKIPVFTYPSMRRLHVARTFPLPYTELASEAEATLHEVAG